MSVAQPTKRAARSRGAKSQSCRLGQLANGLVDEEQLVWRHGPDHLLGRPLVRRDRNIGFVDLEDLRTSHLLSF